MQVFTLKSHKCLYILGYVLAQRNFVLTIFNRILAPAICIALSTGALQAEPLKTAFPGLLEQVSDEYRAGLEALDILQGKIVLPGGQAALDVPDGYYFLDAADARYVLETLWENPPSPETLGMLFPRDKSPIDDSWGIEISFDPMGYVSDEDAAKTDYVELLATMKQDFLDGNDARVKDGYPRIELLGWAAEPRYDAAERKLYWAKTLHFEGEDGNTLNYNIRALGRKGVLVLNFIAGSDQLSQVEAAAPAVLKMISFTDGNRYTDFIPGTDTLAAVGIGGLIAGKVAAKAGLLVLALAFLKKGFVLILLPLIWLKKKLFGKRPET